MNLSASLQNNSVPDETLLTEGIRNGVASSYALLYRDYAGSLQRVISKKIGRNYSRYVPDILQETLLKIFYYREKYDPQKGRLFTWIYNIARNTAVDYLRSRQAHSVSKEDEMLSREYALPESVQAAIINRIDAAKLIASLHKPGDVDLVRLKYLQGYTQSELVSATGLTLSVVKGKSRRILAQLKETFCEEVYLD